ncbi:MAG TPA: ABC transporter substrate-binding protein [Stellaceae bacterium]|nr:ABC transporter substrate-binding protein [Stellaceae bacterium]
MALFSGAAMAWPGTGRAAADVPHVAISAVGFGADTTAFDAIRDSLRGLGDVEGQTYAPDLYALDNVALIPQVAARVVAAKPAVIVTITTQAVPALLGLTRSIPIVVAFSGDPISLGLSKSVARPTGNVTGMLTMQDALFFKRLELLGQIAGPLKRVGFVYDSGNSSQQLLLSRIKSRDDAAEPKIIPLGVSTKSDTGTVLDRDEAKDVDALIVAGSPMIGSERETLIAAEIARRLPAIHDFSFEAQAGALASYGPEPAEYFQRAAEYADRLLRGANVADLPFEAPRTFRLTLNLRTAARIGRTIPPTMLAIADQTIE